MTEEQIREYLKARGYGEVVWQGGSERLIERWKEFVGKVEKEGYTRNWLIDDYWIFLDGRELIHDVGCDDRVMEADERLRSILTATDIKHRHQDRNSDYDFWNYGYPQNATGFFFEQIKYHILKQP